MKIAIVTFLRQYVACYASAVLGGFFALWFRSQGVFAWETWGFLIAIIFMPAVVRMLQNGEDLALAWSRINEFIEQAQRQPAAPSTVTPADIERIVDERVKQRLNEIATAEPVIQRNEKLEIK